MIFFHAMMSLWMFQVIDPILRKLKYYSIQSCGEIIDELLQQLKEKYTTNKHIQKLINPLPTNNTVAYWSFCDILGSFNERASMVFVLSHYLNTISTHAEYLGINDPNQLVQGCLQYLAKMEAFYDKATILVNLPSSMSMLKCFDRH